MQNENVTWREAARIIARRYPHAHPAVTHDGKWRILDRPPRWGNAHPIVNSLSASFEEAMDAAAKEINRHQQARKPTPEPSLPPH